ncbi:MAG: PrsW family intramembrane metalloprotease [Elainella sp.]
MVQSDLHKLAQQGDVAAIAQLLNCELQPRGVTAKLLLRDQCLKILLSAEQPLDQEVFVELVQRQIERLEAPAIGLVKLYGQQIGEGIPAWAAEFIPVYGSGRTAAKSPAKLDKTSGIKAPVPRVTLSKASAAKVAISKASLKNQALAPVSTAAASVAAKGTTAIVRMRTEGQDFLAALRTFQFDSIFPYRDVLSAELYRSNTVRLLLFFSLFPLVINLVAEQVNLEQTAWLLGIYYASIWGVVLYNLIRPVQFSWYRTLKCVGFTALVGIPLLLLFQQVPPFRTLYHAINHGLLFRLVGFILGVGVLEELCKALPVYLLLYRPNRLNDPLSAAFYGAMSGLGFAIAEGVAYSFRYASGLSRGQLDLGSYVAANTIRFVSLPLFHAILAGIVGYFIGLSVINPSRCSALCFVGVLIAATLHGLYNTFAGGLPGLLIIGFTILLFVTYLRRSQQIAHEMHRAELSSRDRRPVD